MVQYFLLLVTLQENYCTKVSVCVVSFHCRIGRPMLVPMSPCLKNWRVLCTWSSIGGGWNWGIVMSITLQLWVKWIIIISSCWKNLFSICEHELEVKASHLWVYLYELCHTETNQEGRFWYVSPKIILILMCCSETVLYQANLRDALIKFVEESCVGDFELRLKMIKSFHMEMITTESTYCNCLAMPC